jgi:hypothetical protein
VFLEIRPDIPLCSNNLKGVDGEFHTGQSVINFAVTTILAQSDATPRHNASWLASAALEDDGQAIVSK